MYVHSHTVNLDISLTIWYLIMSAQLSDIDVQGKTFAWIFMREKYLPPVQVYVHFIC